MAKKNVIIVGAGLFGSIAATMARQRGHQVTVIDNKEKYAASKASGCVLAPSWLTSIPRDEQEVAMNVLKGLYTVHDVPFGNLTGKLFKAQAVHPDDILVKPDVEGTVHEVASGIVHLNMGGGATHLRAGVILVAAGIWSEKLISMPPIKGLYGCSLRLWGVRLEQPFIKVYAPYRQAVGYNLPRNKEAWFGDGTALVEKTWMKEEAKRIADTVERFYSMSKMPVPANRIRARVGARPYVEGYKAGYFAKAGDRLWVSTGGAKNGTVLAAWQAYRFCEEAGL